MKATSLGKATLCIIGILLLAGCEKARLDDEVRRLCAIDGGVKVYETVKLLPDKFDKYGRLTFWDPTQGEQALGSNYVFKEVRKFYRRGDC